MAKVHVRDAIKASLEERYPDESLTFSDRVLKLQTELETCQRFVGHAVPNPIQPLASTETEEQLADALGELVVES